MYHDQFENLSTVTACLSLRDELMNTGRALEIKSIIKTAPKDQKVQLGKELNEIRTIIQTACDERIQTLQEEQEKDNFLEFDPSFYSNQQPLLPGALNPITLVVEDIIAIFSKWGFDVYDGPHIQTQYYNFTAVNTPEYHPARDMQDTFFLEQTDKDGKPYVMRTQVTANAVAYARDHQPPFNVIFPGIVFRNENIDATHDINFTQFDMWLVDKEVTISQLITLIQSFFREFFGNETVTVRLRPSYFPFTQPSLEGDISCPFCEGKGCRICKQTGWIEVFGAGPIHKNVLSHMNLATDEWQGLAFGFGVDRLAQLKLGVSGVAQFYNGNLPFLTGNKS